MSDVELIRPNDKLSITFKGVDRALFMSFQRLNSCLRVLGEPDNLTLFLLDPDMSEGMLKVMLSEKAGIGEMFNIEIAEDDLVYEDIEAILTWVRDHLQHFFLKRFLDLGNQEKTLGPNVELLRSSLVGSEGSTSPEPAAGPSGSVQVTSRTSSADAASSI